MRIFQTVLRLFLGTIFIGAFSIAGNAQPAAAPASAVGQNPAAAPVSAEAAPATAPGTPAAAAITASSVLQPALTQAQATLATIKTDKWKKGSVRDEASQNVAALLHDLQSNIPTLMTAADAEPTALSRSLPLMKHLDAFYDVLLRVEEAARVSAPSEQITALQQTMLDVNKARNTYDDQMQAYAATHEKQIFELQKELKAQQEAASKAKETAAVAPAPCKPATPVHKKKRTTTGSSTTTAKPSAGTPAATKPQ
ncbi:hypothetical protein [Occallatibacter riparius]|uniref:Uncharacterized protein n=1 Tax=Occallatibacter riparius TaxID=1002689 RepID=A0A9J7BSS8_9BACT|nr:hypothetical protein [Occallatibacter riparius]UWZ85641.1 hypothetical protein MOP44_06775 [Occallatibacter riparius]